ncbi:MAG TPA: hypothetical protein VNB23_14995, partial [Ramlibacter sp.]|nr:hypothetical protein [Ramlibacter sp.]
MRRQVLAIAAAGLLCASCDGQRSTPVVDGVRQTGMPGHVTAGGRSSGQVLATTGAPTATQPAGTPGIPQG